MKTFLLIGTLFLAALAPLPAAAAQAVDVTSANVQPLPIAIPDMIAADPAQGQMGANIAGVVRADLTRSGLFRSIDPKAFVEHITNINVAPTYASWRAINAQGLVAGQVTLQPDGRLKVEFRLWDVFGESQMTGQQFFTPARKLATGGAYGVGCDL